MSHRRGRIVPERDERGQWETRAPRRGATSIAGADVQAFFSAFLGLIEIDFSLREFCLPTFRRDGAVGGEFQCLRLRPQLPIESFRAVVDAIDQSARLIFEI